MSLSSIPAEAGRSVRARRREQLTRADVIERLETLFLAEGFSELTVDEICRRLHCSKTTLYAVAPTREQIIQAVTRHFFAHATTVIEDQLVTETVASQRIIQYLGGVGHAMSRNSQNFYRDMVSYGPTAEIYLINSRAAAERVRGLIEEGVSQGEFRRADASLASQAVALLIDGVQSGALLDTTGLTAGEAFTELGELLVNGLATR
jgi:AcrR family transcriptional regulator